MASTYNLINPHILGDFKNQLTAPTSDAAAREFYTNL